MRCPPELSFPGGKPLKPYIKSKANTSGAGDRSDYRKSIFSE